VAKGVPFPEANAGLGAPTAADAAAGTVYALPIHRYRDLDNNPQVLSKWELTAAEIEEVKRTGVVWFSCWGVTHPPMWISGHDPFVRSETAAVERTA
jgi:hypothetical protein